MYIMPFVALLLVVVVAAALFILRTRARGGAVKRIGRLAVGQKWSVRGRDKDPDPTAVIGRIDKIAGGVVVHLSVFGVSIANPQNPDGVSRVLPHLTLSREAFDASVTELLGRGAPAPAFAAGYARWLHDAGGVFTLTLAECLNAIEQALGAAH